MAIRDSLVPVDDGQSVSVLLRGVPELLKNHVYAARCDMGPRVMPADAEAVLPALQYKTLIAEDPE